MVIYLKNGVFNYLFKSKSMKKYLEGQYGLMTPQIAVVSAMLKASSLETSPPYIVHVPPSTSVQVKWVQSEFEEHTLMHSSEVV